MLLVTAEPCALEILRGAYARSVLKPPATYTISSLGKFQRFSSKLHVRITKFARQWWIRLCHFAMIRSRILCKMLKRSIIKHSFKHISLSKVKNLWAKKSKSNGMFALYLSENKNAQLQSVDYGTSDKCPNLSRWLQTCFRDGEFLLGAMSSHRKTKVSPINLIAT